MRKLEEQQEQEERELLERASGAPATDPTSANSTAPIRSRSGNDLVSFGTLSSSDDGGAKDGSRRRADYANAKDRKSVV